MRVRLAIGVIGVLALGSCTLQGQNAGRFEEAKRMALAYIQSEQFDKAAGRLEEVWEQDHSDPAVGENLALAYLNTEDRHSLPELQKRAFALMEQLTAADERISFLVQHSHEKAAWLQGRQWNSYCRGRLSLTAKGLVYLAEKGKDAERHSFEMSFGSLESGAIELDDGGRGVFRLKTPKGAYVMKVRNENGEESRFLAGLVKRHLK